MIKKNPQVAELFPKILINQVISSLRGEDEGQDRSSTQQLNPFKFTMKESDPTEYKRSTENDHELVEFFDNKPEGTSAASNPTEEEKYPANTEEMKEERLNRKSERATTKKNDDDVLKLLKDQDFKKMHGFLPVQEQ